jgi:hypothetical protein
MYRAICPETRIWFMGIKYSVIIVKIRIRVRKREYKAFHMYACNGCIQTALRKYPVIAEISKICGYKI